MCHACKVDFTASVAKAREEVWGLLPVWFGLAPQPVSGEKKKKEKCSLTVVESGLLGIS